LACCGVTIPVFTASSVLNLIISSLIIPPD
jgi:hypothetical protein